MGPHATLLSLSTDGRISDAAWREARRLDALDASVPARRQGAGVRVVAFNARDVVARMVRVIAEAVPKREAVHERDFEQAGIDPALARRHFAEAFALARAREPAIDALSLT